MLLETMSVVTHFGTVLLLAPFSLLIALWLALRVGRREALLWCACVAGVGITLALLKIWFGTCHVHWHGVHSPSGHTGFSSIAYGGFTVIAMSGSRSLRANLFRLGMLLWVLLIGYSRVVVHAHTRSEVLCGLVVGGLAVAIFASLYRSRVRPPYLLAGGILAVIGVIAVMLPTQVVTLEPWLNQIARALAPYESLICGS